MNPAVVRSAAALLLWLFAAAARADAYTGQVTAVLSGDTLAVTDGTGLEHRVRLRGIEVPPPGQPFAGESKTALAALAFGKEVRVECGASAGAEQRCRVLAGAGDLGLALVRGGMARRDRRTLRGQPAAERAEYEQAEFQAQMRRLGLWSARGSPAPRPIP